MQDELILEELGKNYKPITLGLREISTMKVITELEEIFTVAIHVSTRAFL